MRWTPFNRIAQRWVETLIAKRLVSHKIRRILGILYPSRDPEEVCRAYYHEKLVLILRIGAVICILILFVMISEYVSSRQEGGNVLMRGEDNRQITLKVQTDGSDETSVMYELHPKQYTPAQIRQSVNK